MKGGGYDVNINRHYCMVKCEKQKKIGFVCEAKGGGRNDVFMNIGVNCKLFSLCTMHNVFNPSFMHIGFLKLFYYIHNYFIPSTAPPPSDIHILN